MIIFPDGILITTNENACLLRMVPDVEIWLTNSIAHKAIARRDALISEWRPRLYADESVTELPANDDDLAALILARNDYKTRLQQDAIASPVIPIYKFATNSYNKVTRSGSTVTLFPSGITIDDLASNCMLAYVQDLEEWVYGALVGQINRGKKIMISTYHPIIMADPSVTTMPATEDGLITMILARKEN